MPKKKLTTNSWLNQRISFNIPVKGTKKQLRKLEKDSKEYYDFWYDKREIEIREMLLLKKRNIMINIAIDHVRESI